MRLLLDTCVMLWLAREPGNISKTAAAALDNSANELFLSHASIWEIYLKAQAGKLSLPQTPRRWITAQLTARRITDWPLDLETLHRTNDLPLHHRDPFDRLLIAQTLTHSMTLVSPDPWIQKYRVKNIW